MKTLWLILACGLGLAVRGAEFYVSRAGNDAHDGTSPRHAWKTVDRVNRHVAEFGLAPGDRIRFRGGDSFAGNLMVDRVQGGTREQPVVIGSFGKGKATLLADGGTGIRVKETPWVVIEELQVRAGRTNDGDGIRFDRVHNDGRRIPGVTIRNCRVEGFAWHGVMIDAAATQHGFDGVRITGTEALRNRHAGIMVYGGNPTGRSHHAHRDVVVEQCRAGENPGDPAELNQHSGSGILVDGSEEVRIAGCLAWGNGFECRSERGGPVGIWVHACDRAVIEGCESFGNGSSLRDGGGFDLDGGCTESVLRRNFSHDNQGPGFLVYTYAGAPYADRDCRVEGNISWNDGRKGTGYGGLQVGSESGCRIEGLWLSDNLILSPPGSVASVKIQGHHVHAICSNNVVVAAPYGVLCSVSGFDHRLRFLNNRFWRPDGRPVFLVDTQWPVPTLEQWAATNPKDLRIVAEGNRFEDPGIRLTLPGSDRAGRRPRWPTLGPAVRPEALSSRP